MNYKIFFLILTFIFFLGCSSQNKVCFEDNCFDVEIAETSEERSNGLMHRESMEKSEGMLFIFEEPATNTFWMKNTLIPLDIIWMNENKEVIFINKDTKPCKSDPCLNYGPAENSFFVLELNSGVSDEVGLEVGDVLTFDIEN